MTDTGVRSGESPQPLIVNTHVHVPPNFSAYVTVTDAVTQAAAQGVRAVGISNFFDQQVYRQFAEEASAAGIVALFGLEFITLVEELAVEGVRVNDPANPGRMYLCGKGISPFQEKSPKAARIATEIRQGNDRRAEAMVGQLAAWFLRCGLDTGLTAEGIAADVARRGGVPIGWVSLQERHIARAFQEAVAVLPLVERTELLERAYVGAPGVDVDDPVALQGEIRSRLLKVGTPGFAPEVALAFEDAYAYVLEMDGIPCYPTLADGVSPVCPFEDSPASLAERLLVRGIHAAELIPIRNTSAVVDEYVAAFTEAGIVVMAGTEHNTADRIPLDPACVDGPVSESARKAFWEGTCIVAAHQHLVAQGAPGYVDTSGALVGPDPAQRRADLVALGARLINGVIA